MMQRIHKYLACTKGKQIYSNIIRRNIFHKYSIVSNPLSFQRLCLNGLLVYYSNINNHQNDDIKTISIESSNKEHIKFNINTLTYEDKKRFKLFFSTNELSNKEKMSVSELLTEFEANNNKQPQDALKALIYAKHLLQKDHKLLNNAKTHFLTKYKEEYSKTEILQILCLYKIQNLSNFSVEFLDFLLNIFKYLEEVGINTSEIELFFKIVFLNIKHLRERNYEEYMNIDLNHPLFLYLDAVIIKLMKTSFDPQIIIIIKLLSDNLYLTEQILTIIQDLCLESANKLGNSPLDKLQSIDLLNLLGCFSRTIYSESAIIGDLLERIKSEYLDLHSKVDYMMNLVELQVYEKKYWEKVLPFILNLFEGGKKKNKVELNKPLQILTFLFQTDKEKHSLNLGHYYHLHKRLLNEQQSLNKLTAPQHMNRSNIQKHISFLFKTGLYGTPYILGHEIREFIYHIDLGIFLSTDSGVYKTKTKIGVEVTLNKLFRSHQVIDVQDSLRHRLLTGRNWSMVYINPQSTIQDFHVLSHYSKWKALCLEANSQLQGKSIIHNTKDVLNFIQARKLNKL